MSSLALAQRCHTFAVRAQRSSPRARVLSVKAMATDAVKATIASAPVVVFSKTYCPHCTALKGLFSQLNVPVKLVELDIVADGAEQQSALAQLTNQRTVPNVFIGGKHVGGNDVTQGLHRDGKLMPMLKAVSAL